MAKLYRLVPDSITSIILTQMYSQVTEDLFYRQNMVEAYSYGYFGLYKKGTGNTAESYRKTMFFFTSPWSCIKGQEFMRDYYGGRRSREKFVVRILEYDIPDEIVSNSDDVFTNCGNYQAKGKLIPVALLQGNRVLHNTLDEEMRLKLEKQALEDAKETITALSEFCSPDFMAKLSAYIDEEWKDIIKERLTLKENEGFFETDIITGRTMLVTSQDYELLSDVRYRRKPEEDLQILMDKSNGILTPENLKDYDGDAATHRYGFILTY